MRIPYKKMIHKRAMNFNSNMNQVIVICILGFICVVSCHESKKAVKFSHIIPGSRQIERDKFFSVAKKINRKDNYSEIFSMQNEIVPSIKSTKQYENYKLLSIKISCFDKTNSDKNGEMLSAGQEKKTVHHAKDKYENILRIFQHGKLLLIHYNNQH